MPETSYLARKYTHIRSFRKYTFQYQDPLNSVDVSIFDKKSAFFGKNSTFTQSNSARVVFFSSVPSESSFRIAPNWPKIGKTIMTSRYFIYIVKFSCWSKFHANIITVSGTMTIFLYKRYTLLEIPLPDFCPISGDWGELGIPNLAEMSLIKFY